MRNPALIASLFFALFAPMLVANCSSDAIQSATDKSAYASQQRAINEGDQPNPIAVLASADVSPGDYRISPRDVIEIQVFQVNDLNKTVQVAGDGNISLPLIGKTAVGGKTTHEAEQLIGEKLRKKYLQSPQVSVMVKQYGQKVTVSGAVNTPHVLSIEGTLTLSQAIASSGGLTEIANTSRVHIARVVDGHVSDDVYNLDDVQAAKIRDPSLRAGDIVVAEQSGAKLVFKNLKDMLPFAVLASVL